jgi:HAD superfamily hydrolase (TIGR01509 family)
MSYPFAPLSIARSPAPRSGAQERCSLDSRLRGYPVRNGRRRPLSAAIIDVDGTLVDTNYQHAIAWYRAFRDCGAVLQLWRIHRHIGMGGDQIVPSLAGPGFEREHGEEVRSAEKRHYMQLIGEVEPMDRARDLLEALRRRGHSVVLASSAKPDEIEHYRDLLDAHELADGWTTSADVRATKPEPDLVIAALEKAGAPASEAVMIGDSTWDVKAAQRAGVQTLGVMTGGFCEEELLEAGAAKVFESVADLCDALDTTVLR